MTKKVPVTPAQKRAAQMIVERSAVSGKAVRPGVAKIAGVTGASYGRSTVTGRYVAKSASVRHPSTTVTETVVSKPKRPTKDLGSGPSIA